MRDSKGNESWSQHSLQKKPDVQEDKAFEAVCHCLYQRAQKNSKI